MCLSGQWCCMSGTAADQLSLCSLWAAPVMLGPFWRRLLHSCIRCVGCAAADVLGLLHVWWRGVGERVGAQVHVSIASSINACIPVHSPGNRLCSPSRNPPLPEGLWEAQSSLLAHPPRPLHPPPPTAGAAAELGTLSDPRCQC